MTIRQYSESDVEAVLTAWETASAVAHPFLSDEFMVTERKNIVDLYLPNADTWVCEVDGEVVGFIALVGNEVGGLFVEPRWHGKRIGYALMNHAREIHGELEVEVFKANTIGRAFYDRYGFTLLEEKVHEETGFEVLRMRLG